MVHLTQWKKGPVLSRCCQLASASEYLTGWCIHIHFCGWNEKEIKRLKEWSALQNAWCRMQYTEERGFSENELLIVSFKFTHFDGVSQKGIHLTLIMIVGRSASHTRAFPFRIILLTAFHLKCFYFRSFPSTVNWHANSFSFSLIRKWSKM